MTINIGYEVEFLSRLNQGQMAENIRPLNLVFQRNHNREYREWLMATDGSLRGSGGRGNVGHEIISPIMPLEEGLEKLEAFFNWMTANEHYTNSTCGFHVGVSNADPAVQARLDPLKLALIFDANSVLRDFGRIRSTYCIAIKRRLMDNIRRQAPYWNAHRVAFGGGNPGHTWNHHENDTDKLRALLPFEKFTSSNLTKLASGYVEFRCMGNEGYHTRFADVKRTILNYAECIAAAADPDSHAREFDTELTNILNMTARIREVETERHGERIRREMEQERIRLAPILERDAARSNRRAENVEAARARRARLNAAAALAAQQAAEAVVENVENEVDETLAA